MVEFFIRTLHKPEWAKVHSDFSRSDILEHHAGRDIIFVNPPCSDPNVEANRQALLDRSRNGKEKYGTDLTRNDLSPSEWAQHAIEELLDGANYLQRLKVVLAEQDKKIEELERKLDAATTEAAEHANALWSAQFYLRHTAFQDFTVNRMLEILESSGAERKSSQPKSPVFDGSDCAVQGDLSEGG